MKKLNLGCGNNKIDGYTNVDAFPHCQPDLVFNVETFPWPWEDDSIDGVLFHQSLEHMGETTEVFLKIITELYRVCKNGAEIEIHVPHPRSDNFINDPTHVRIITPQLLQLFDKNLNDKWKLNGSSATPLAHYLGVDFRIKAYNLTLEEPYKTQYYTQKISIEELGTFIRERSNVASGFIIIISVNKPID